MPMASKCRSFFSAVFYSFALSFCVETFQLLTKVGSFDVDDLLLNTIGAAIGYTIFTICAVVRRQHDKKAKRRYK
jgi:glycopeptide antibiotics resistance protein